MANKITLNLDINNILATIKDKDFPAYLKAVDRLVKVGAEVVEQSAGPVAAKLLMLKVSNLLVANYEMTHRHLTLVSHPVGMLIDPSNGCGLRCPGCVHSGKLKSWDWPSGLLKESVYQSFLDEHGPFAIDVYLANYGEPLLSPLTPRLIQIARRYGLPTFTSSSLSVPAKLTHGVVESGLNFMICSIDGATEEIYLKYRRKGDFHQAIENIRFLVAEKKRLNSYTPVLHWQFLVFQHNRHEVDAVIALAKELGVNQISLVAPFNVSWDDPKIHGSMGWETRTIVFEHDRRRYVEHLATMSSDLSAAAIERHFAVTWSERLAGKPEITAELAQKSPALAGQKTCNWLYKSLTMDGHGRIMPCARPPSKTGDLVFTRESETDHFNSAMHKLGRQAVIDADGYREALAASASPQPYCAKCEHRDQKADIDTQETCRKILQDVSLYTMLDDQTKVALTDW